MNRTSIATMVLLSTLIPAATLVGQAIPKPYKCPVVPIIERARSQSNQPINRSLGFDFENVILHSWLDLGDFGNPSNGSDCWGYTSPSGREYALMGLYNKMTVVEITNPANPVIIDSVSHTGSLWADIKVYQDVAYVSNESGGGIDVIDLSNVDNGVITLVQRMTTNGLSHVHNLAIDTDSGFLYLCSSDLNGGRTVVFDLSNPHYPTIAGQINSGPSFHDAQVVTYNTGPFAGRQIC